MLVRWVAVLALAGCASAPPLVPLAAPPTAALSEPPSAPTTSVRKRRIARLGPPFMGASSARHVALGSDSAAFAAALER